MESGRWFLMGFERSPMIYKIVEMPKEEVFWKSQAICDVSYSNIWKDKLHLSAVAEHFNTYKYK